MHGGSPRKLCRRPTEAPKLRAKNSGQLPCVACDLAAWIVCAVRGFLQSRLVPQGLCCACGSCVSRSCQRSSPQCIGQARPARPGRCGYFKHNSTVIAGNVAPCLAYVGYAERCVPVSQVGGTTHSCRSHDILCSSRSSEIVTSTRRSAGAVEKKFGKRWWLGASTAKNCRR